MASSGKREGPEEDIKSSSVTMIVGNPVVTITAGDSVVLVVVDVDVTGTSVVVVDVTGTSVVVVVVVVVVVLLPGFTLADLIFSWTLSDCPLRVVEA